MTKAELDAIALEVAKEVYEIHEVQTLSLTAGAQTFAHCFLERIKGEPKAWLHQNRPDADVITDAVKNVWNGVAVGKEALYSIPLYHLPEIEK